MNSMNYFRDHLPLWVYTEIERPLLFAEFYINKERFFVEKVLEGERYLRKNMIGIAIIAVLVVIFFINLSEDKTAVKVKKEKESDQQPSSVQEEEAQKAVDFTLPSLTGDEITLSALRGKTVIINLWATWCPPCRQEMPHMQKFYEEHQEEVEILAVNLTSEDYGKERVAQFVSEFELTFPVLLDYTGEVGKLYKAFTIPTSYVIDKHGMIFQKIVGPMDDEYMEQLITALKETEK